MVIGQAEFKPWSIGNVAGDCAWELSMKPMQTVAPMRIRSLAKGRKKQAATKLLTTGAGSPLRLAAGLESVGLCLRTCSTRSRGIVVLCWRGGAIAEVGQ